MEVSNHESGREGAGASFRNLSDRSSHYASRTLSQALEPRRTSSVVERAPRRNEPHRASARFYRGGSMLSALGIAPPADASRAYGIGPDSRPQPPALAAKGGLRYRIH